MSKFTKQFEFFINTTWDNQKLDHEPIEITFETPSDTKDYLIINIKAKYFGSPAEPVHFKPGDFFNLWDYEVVETFFKAESSGKYLELEFGPHGHYQVLTFDGVRQTLNKGLLLDFTSSIDKANNYWTGQAKIPGSYFPNKTNQMNAYAIHGDDKENERVYESLYPVPYKKYEFPDFHRLEYFEHIDFDKLMPKNWLQNRQEDELIWSKKI